MSVSEQPVEVRSRLIYSPLNCARREIRLLSLIPGLQSCRIECRLFTTSFWSGPRYDALSYTWGDPSVEEEISVNGVALKVRRNLWHALRDLRDPTRPRLLWIDALCINQNDLEERGKQVAIMGNIYRVAQNVEIYLGPESVMTKGTVDLIRQLGSYIEARIDEYTVRQSHWHVNMAKILDHTGARNHPGLFAFFTLPWFRRVWVVQEYALARSTRVYWGTECFPFSHLLNITTVFTIFGSSGRDEMGVGVSNIKHMIHCVPGPTRCQMSLLALLRAFRSFNATDPRDKLYALLSLVSKTEGFEITPKYTSTVKEVYTELVRAYATTTKNLDILVCCLLDTASNNNLPSWAPDWSSETPLIESHAIRRRYILTGSERSMNPGWYAHHPYKSSFDTDAKVSFNGVNSEMTVQGFIVSAVSSTIPASEQEPWLSKNRTSFGVLNLHGRSTGVSPVFNTWLNHLLNEDRVWWRCRSKAAIIETLYRVITGNRSSLCHPWAEARYTGHYMQLPFTDGETLPPSYRLAALKLRGYFKDMISPPRQDKLLTCATMDDAGITNRLYRRRLIVLRNGFVGGATGPCEPGDLVCVFFGCTMPMVLRKEPREDWFRIVGPAYVYGVCEGELMKADVKAREFRIR